MGTTTTKLSFEEFQKLQEVAEETVRYELDEGELVLTPSPTAWHNIVRYNLRHALTVFVKTHPLGLVLDETDFRLASNTVRKPDVAFIAQHRLENLDLHQSPLSGAPSLAAEIISPSTRTQDTTKKVRQYVASGSHSVWLVYPSLRLVEIYDATGAHDVTEPQSIQEEKLFPGLTFSLPLAVLFDER